MAEVNIDDKVLKKIFDFALMQTVLYLGIKIREITPRDLQRLPEDINRKDGKVPTRSSGRPPVNIGGNWYPGVTGNLKRSIGHEKVNSFFFLIGVKKGPATAYAAAQEFGTVYIPPRSYIRKGIFDNINGAKKEFQRAANTFLK